MEKNTGKTIFIVITRGFIVRNILRSGVLSELKKPGHRIVVFLSVRGHQIPQYLKDEFEDNQVILEAFPEEKRSRLYIFTHRIFAKMVSFLVYTDSTWVYSQIGNDTNLQRSRYKMFVERFVFGFLSRSKLLKRAARYIDRKVFSSRVARAFFDQYQPSVVFSTSVISAPDIAVMQEARRRGIKTVSMPKGWDNVTKSLYRFVPDRLIVHNEIMKEGAIREQKIPAEKITVSGFPQFDWTRRPEIIHSREQHLSEFGFDPSRRLIFFGSEGAWTPKDDVIVDMIIKGIEEGRIQKPCSILIRAHYSDVKNKRFDRFRGIPHVVVDDTINVSDVLYCNWDPDNKETELFTNSLYHCDMMITTASTLVLDAACFDKPIITVGFGVLYDKDNKDVSPILYDTDHFQAVMEEHAVDMVLSEEELIARINDALFFPERKREERAKLLRKMCYLVDGHASQRMAEAILGEIQ